MPSPAPPRFPRLTYKSATVSGRRERHLEHHRENHRAATTLGTNPPPRRRRHPNTLPRLSSTRRSCHPRPLRSDATLQTDSTRSSRAVYHATTASARAAEMRSQPAPAFQYEHRERPSRSGTDLGDVSRQRASSGLFSDREEPKRVTRVVVKRRVIRGSPVFRPATEEELDEFLQVEKFREMVTIPETEIDIPPSTDLPICEAIDVERDLCAVCAGQLPAKKTISKRGMRRVSSLLSRAICEDDEVLRISEMAAMDDYKAVALFLREIRKYRKEMFMSMQEKSDRPDRKRREKKRRVIEEKDVDVNDIKRSVSADSPELLRMVRRQERLIASARKRMKDSERRARSEVVCLNEDWKEERHKSEVDEEDVCDSLRILTALEPVDPTEALDDDEACRNESYRDEGHRRRRGLRMVGEAGILGRLRSFRRKAPVQT